MLTLQPEIVEQYVKTGQVQLVFWPVLNHGNASVAASVTLECVAQQSFEQAWALHHNMFSNVAALYGASRDDYINYALQVGANQELFEACYDGEEALQLVLDLDQIRRERGVRGQPYFHVGDTLLAGTAQLMSTIVAELE